MPKDAVFTMKLEPELRAEFLAEAEAAHRPASQILREMMREFIQRQRDARDYDAFLRRKVEAARASMRAGQAGRMMRSKPSSPPGARGPRVKGESRLDA